MRLIENNFAGLCWSINLIVCQNAFSNRRDSICDVFLRWLSDAKQHLNNWSLQSHDSLCIHFELDQTWRRFQNLSGRTSINEFFSGWFFKLIRFECLLFGSFCTLNDTFFTHFLVKCLKFQKWIKFISAGICREINKALRLEC